MVELEEFRHGGTNITGYRLVDPQHETVKEVTSNILAIYTENMWQLCLDRSWKIGCAGRPGWAGGWLERPPCLETPCWYGTNDLILFLWPICFNSSLSMGEKKLKLNSWMCQNVSLFWYCNNATLVERDKFIECVIFSIIFSFLTRFSLNSYDGVTCFVVWN